MSVINKMLRDLDGRHAVRMPGRGGRQSAALNADLIAGTVALGAHDAAQAAQSSKLRLWMVLGGALVLVLVGGFAGWLGWGQAVKPSALAPVLVPQTVAQPAIKPVIQPSSVAAAPQAAAAVSVAVAGASLAPAVLAKPKSTSVSAVVSVAVSPLVGTPAKVSSSEQLAAARSAPPVFPVLPPTPVLPKSMVQPLKSAPQAAMDVLAQAQVQWNQSDQAGALALVQGALAYLEQSPVADNTALAALAREHTRMSLAMGYPQAALATLVRLEPQLSAVADIWALRGNINQRLGQHPRSVQAYLAALALRSNEPRWMLGAAVSLAIQGQTGPAAEWAEKARLAGGLRPDVANYLRQLGVEIRAD